MIYSGRKLKRKLSELRVSRPIKKWIEEERSREMLVRKGAENFVLSKLLAIILRIGKAGMSAEDLAKILLNRYGSLRALDSVSFSELSKIEGIGLTKAVQIKAAFVL